MQPQDHARSLADRGQAALGEGQAKQALAFYDSALRHQSDYSPALYGRCLALQALGRAADLVAACERALCLAPDMAELHHCRGVGLRLLKRWSDAEASFRQAIVLRPGAGDGYGGLGITLDLQGRHAEARKAYEAAIERNPSDADSLNNLGNLLAHGGQRQAAVESYRRAIRCRPGFAEAFNNLGTALAAGGDLEGALEAYRTALALKPDLAAALVNLGAGLASAGDHRAAVETYGQALVLDPDNAQARWNRGLARLHLKDFEGGWLDYASRWRTKDFQARRRNYPQPPWQGQALAGCKILLWSEQGIGDELMFLGLMPELMVAGARIVFECDQRLIPLVARSMPAIELVARRDTPDPRANAADIDVQAPTADLLRWLRPTTGTIRQLGGYLAADPARAAALRATYRGGTGKRLLGLSWHSTNPAAGPRRSLPATDLAPFLTLPGWQAVDLQYGDRSDDRGRLEQAAGQALLHDPGIDALGDLDGWAAQVAAMDTVVTIDNSTAHLAAALGGPVLLLLPTVTDWRWFEAGDATPWYGRMRLLRQTSSGDWSGPLAQALALLRA